MSLSVIPLTILGQITGVTGSGETALYQVSFKSIDGTPLYGVTAVWTDEQAEIEALAAQKPYGVWINPIDGTFTVKFAGYTYVGSADLTDPDVLAGITPVEFTSAEVSDRLLPEVTAEDNGDALNVINGGWSSGSIDTDIILTGETDSFNTLLTNALSTALQNASEDGSFVGSVTGSEGYAVDFCRKVQRGYRKLKGILTIGNNEYAYECLIDSIYHKPNPEFIDADDPLNLGQMSFKYNICLNVFVAVIEFTVLIAGAHGQISNVSGGVIFGKTITIGD